jgi:regulator of replication initiation timing
LASVGEQTEDVATKGLDDIIQTSVDGVDLDDQATGTNSEAAPSRIVSEAASSEGEIAEEFLAKGLAEELFTTRRELEELQQSVQEKMADGQQTKIELEELKAVRTHELLLAQEWANYARSVTTSMVEKALERCGREKRQLQSQAD